MSLLNLQLAQEINQTWKNKSMAFDILKERVKECWIIINDNWFPKVRVWTTYRRLYEDTEIDFSIKKLLKWNKAIAEISEWNKVTVKISEWNIIEYIENVQMYYKGETEFTITEKMKKWLSIFGISIES